MNGDDGRSVCSTEAAQRWKKSAGRERKEDNKRSVLKHTGRDFGRRLPSGLLSRPVK